MENNKKSVLISDRQHNQIKRVSLQTDLSIQELVGIAVENFIKATLPKEPSQ